MKDKKISLTIFLLIAFLIIGMLGFSYAYFKINLVGSGKTNVVVSGELKLDFNDEVSISQSAIYPGDSFTKTFTVSNAGAETLGYAVEWEEYNNTFINGEIHISLTCLSYINYSISKEISGECEGIEEREATEEPLKEGVEIGTGITHEYEIRLTFIETGENQDYNKNKIFNATLKVVDNVVLAINLGDGEIEQTFKSGYEPGETIELTEPEKEIHTFLGWSVTGYGSSIEGNTLTIGSKNTTITANWKIYPLLTVNLNGGTTTQTFSQRYPSNSIIKLTRPIKDGHVHSWAATGTGSSVEESTLTIGTEDTTLTASWIAFADMYTYKDANGNNGSSTVINDGNGNWRIKLSSVGEYIFKPLTNMITDVFVVGGGGGGGVSSSGNIGAGGGGSGYAVTHYQIALTSGSSYTVYVGSGGSSNNNGENSYFSTTTYSASGGLKGNGITGGDGGCGGGGGGYSSDYSAGMGGSYGSNAIPGSGNGGAGGIGQNTTTCEFGLGIGTTSCESGVTVYGGGGSGGAGKSGGGTPGPQIAGGSPGGGAGGRNSAGVNGVANTGGGGGGGGFSGFAGGTGGSGIVIVRNTRIDEMGDTEKYQFAYTGYYKIEGGNTDNWKIKFLSTGNFKILSGDFSIDAFVVGGGGGGGVSSSGNIGAGGGGSGYTATYTNISLTEGSTYPVQVGNGGSSNNNGENSYFSTTTYSASGGLKGNGITGGNGGCGGGGGGYSYDYSAGKGGSYGSNAIPGSGNGGAGGIGQNTTTCEFGLGIGTTSCESGVTVYGGGGSGGAGKSSGGTPGPQIAGGSPGGGAGGRNSAGSNGIANTGGGAGGGGFSGFAGGIGGSGIVIIRNRP